ncbi:MAG TPA: endonuclease/exonuclease/phosphatase family protein [Bryobacteraceae bacterium]|nr:endonuclease/exonuclease/phosphatase family protein [Bryobacteraceae bacterium]
MKLLVWNIRQGGGPRQERIATSIAAHDADLIALIEFVPSTALPLLARLREAGLEHQTCAEKNGHDHTICVLSKAPITARQSESSLLNGCGLWLEVCVPDRGFSAGIVHVPTKGNQKRHYCDALVDVAERRCRDPFVFAGDFNTGRHPEDGDLQSLGCVDRFESMQNAGFRDAWRHFHGDRKESTFAVKGKEYRIDHALASAGLIPRLTACRYSHEERSAGESDHSVLLFEIED